MDEKKQNSQQEDTAWLDEILESAEIGSEIVPDEQAMDAQGLRDMEDMELEKIMHDVINDDWDLADIIEEAPPIPIQDNDYADSTDPEGNLIFPQEEAQDGQGGKSSEEENDDVDPVRKVRPRRKGGYGLFGLPHLASVVIWIALILAIGVSIGRLAWVCATDVLAFGREDQPVYVTIYDSDNIDTITDKLYDSGLIRYKQLFKLYAGLAKADKKISVGTFKLNTLFDYHALVNGMKSTSSYRETISVSIPEGFSCAQIFKLLEEKGVCAAEDLEDYAAASDFADYWFLEGIQRGHKYSLEGFLYPDTYEFYTNDTPKRVFIKFLNNFTNKFEEVIKVVTRDDGTDAKTYIENFNKQIAGRMKKSGYGQDYIDAHRITVHEIITVASMIEKESANSGENYTISSVIYNRLVSPSFPFLNIDATLVYALGGKTELTEADKQLDSPYNTYKHKGLTPGAISNPGLLSIQAALKPADTGFYYYALDPKANEHHFSKTLKEHQAFLDSLKK